MTTNETIPVRKIDLPFDQSIPKHWIDGSPVATHFFNGLNLVFPDGERFFIRAVQDHLDRITDESLRTRVKGFFGQEGRHAHEHERYFEILEAQGYRIDRFLRRFHRFILLSNRFMPAALRLSVTAGAEHYTATLGATALDNPLLESAHPVMRKLIYWHALRRSSTNRWPSTSCSRRIPATCCASPASSWPAVPLPLDLHGHAHAGAPGRHRPAHGAGEIRRLRRVTHAQMERAINEGVREYLRRDFHPDHKDDSALARRGLAAIGEPLPA